MDKNELAAILKSNDPRLLEVKYDNVAMSPLLYQSTGSIVGGLSMQQTWNSGATGKNAWVAVIDTGVTLTNQEFSGSRQYLQACYNTNEPINNKFSTCLQPDASGSSPRVYSGRSGTYSNPCGRGRPVIGGTSIPTDDDTCKHGDRVAAIALGNPPSLPAYKGVAYESNIFAINVGTLESYPGSNARRAIPYSNDVKKALNAVAGIGNSYRFVVNMSLGYNAGFTGSCDNFDAGITQVINTLKFQYKIPVVSATGNNSSRGSINWPACINNVIKVVATRKDTGGFAPLSNAGDRNNFPGVWWGAPGYALAVPINGVVSTSYQNLIDGTSFAAPHIAGVYSVMRGILATSTVDEISNFMETYTANYVSVQTQPSNSMTAIRRFSFN